MSVYIIISQTARLGAVWSSKLITRQVLLSLSILAYSVVMIQRNEKINKYYDRSPADNSDRKPGDRN